MIMHNHNWKPGFKFPSRTVCTAAYRPDHSSFLLSSLIIIRQPDSKFAVIAFGKAVTDASRVSFGMGRFEFDGSKFMVMDFIVYNDGLVAVAEKTEWAEAFLENVVSWVKSEFGFREISSGIRKLYGSTLIVDFERPLSRLLSDYNQIAELISSRSITIMPHPHPMQFSRLEFEVDKATLEGQTALPKFILERRGGVPFSQERYYAVAPMHTADHIDVLTEIEKLAARS
jgi:hypothetical protein